MKTFQYNLSFANTFISWSSSGYGDGHAGTEAVDMLTYRLGAADGVIHNQDNREHDILDSDDYWFKDKEDAEDKESQQLHDKKPELDGEDNV